MENQNICDIARNHGISEATIPRHLELVREAKAYRVSGGDPIDDMVNLFSLEFNDIEIWEKVNRND